jgi:hypothetical protein
MDILVLIGLTVSLLAITCEDWQTRSVHTYWFALTFLCLGYWGYNALGISDYAVQYGVNFLFLCLYFLLLQIYFVLKHRRWVWIFDTYIGWGDVIFLLCIAGYWNLFGFVVFIVVSLLLSLLVYFIVIKRRKSTIPLAGLQSIVFIIFFYLEEEKLLSLNNLISQLL